MPDHRHKSLCEKLSAIPVWMVRDMAPGWQEHGTTAYNAVTAIDELHAEIARLREAVKSVISIADKPAPQIAGRMSTSDFARLSNAHLGVGLVMVLPDLRKALEAHNG